MPRYFFDVVYARMEPKSDTLRERRCAVTLWPSKHHAKRLATQSGPPAGGSGANHHREERRGRVVYGFPAN
jgi:hypothetical protein